ncbi:eukaryotic translation initiation factor [Capsaspora owczarzaki ATCC 30864]|uniref:Eukaryotic translation initiation factor n=1 Tax=Capsaspora owczarzaki (strain ATCC 30864) TaxID=595528 RepID=A0A0D2WV75_CAPO3|nr:eukaryotic translation initiation factor [Capsaspora owczarzaki ATCC 30864]KJE96680.1 eukaryotic translation initiation factor [Capsaspora owczarzaki ATCC 30864]KJE96681.1 eukaryotic translation initiation factor, variant [Capsaspora owczarzaki ATCC 30864]|eukprot:XP_004343686.1 eukaryotic translation initiation factor [Capsaspora owczarzaki ATCC 30864]
MQSLDLSLKKKKKKKKPALDLEDGASPAVDELTDKTEALSLNEEAAPADADLTGKKKKKKSKSASEEAPAEEEPVAEEPLEEIDTSIKKKKKKSKALDEELDAEAAVAAAEAAENDMFGDDAPADDTGDLDLSGKKKKKKKKAAEAGEEEDDVFASEEKAPVAAGAETWLGSDRDYTYPELLQRVFDIMRAKNPTVAVGEKRRFVMKPPQVLRIGAKKCALVNFVEICSLMRRTQDHVLLFILSELGTTGSMDGNNHLIVKGRFQQKQMETVLRHYIREYVTCHTCKSPETNLTKENRLSFLQCETCGSTCSVAAIKAGFQAITTKRAAMRTG